MLRDPKTNELDDLISPEDLRRRGGHTKEVLVLGTKFVFKNFIKSEAIQILRSRFLIYTRLCVYKIIIKPLTFVTYT